MEYSHNISNLGAKSNSGPKSFTVAQGKLAEAIVGFFQFSFSK